MDKFQDRLKKSYSISLNKTEQNFKFLMVMILNQMMMMNNFNNSIFDEYNSYSGLK